MDIAHSQTVLKKLNEQRSQGLFCDVTIVVEDVKFQAHKNILAACSGYFRNALTTHETWSPCQVLELMDLKSDVFASILNFIYCSKVTSPCADDTGGLVAAAKRLGIPFLEKLADQERKDSFITQNLPECVQSTDTSIGSVPNTTKKEAPRPEEIDSARGPRITNAFSITEVCPGNNPFTPLIQTNVERQSPDVGQLPASCPTSSCLNGNNETTHTLSEHSYAVNQATEEGDNSQWDNNKVCKSAISQPKQLFYQNTGPLKKRHRLRGTLGRNILPAPEEPHRDKPNTVNPTLAVGAIASPAAVMTPPPLFSVSETDNRMATALPVAHEQIQMELAPPTLSPHTEDSISIYGCDHCPEIFTNKALLTIHSEVHKKRFVSHLFCKFCHRKFIHLKRLHNHEQVCLKAARSSPRKDTGDISTQEVDDHTGDTPTTEDIAQIPAVDHSTPYNPQPPKMNQSEPQQDERTIKPGGSQRRYNCSMCKRVYVTLSSLKRHENVHSWQRAYPCHYCNKVFALAEYRTKHEIWHTGERRYQCIFCLETFMTYYILKNHQKSFHGIDPTLAVKRKSANGGLKASVYPIKLYRLLPMKFRKRQYKTYSQTYAEGDERGDELPIDSNSLVSPYEGNGMISQTDSTSLPLTFMTTTKMVAPVMPRISFDKPCDKNMDQGFNTEVESCHQRGTTKEAEQRGSPQVSYESTFPMTPDTGSLPVSSKDGPLHLINSQQSHNVPLFNSFNTVRKLGELSASAKRVENMTKEILQSGTENLVLNKTVGAKTETYLAKPACPGPSGDGDAMPLCQITVKIGNEAIIRRRIKGSKLFPRKKRRIREEGELESPGHHHPIRDKSESSRLRLRPEATATTGPETYDDHTECDMADKLWRPYYSYKAKKKKKLRFKHRQLFYNCPETSGDRNDAIVGESLLDSWRSEESISGGTGEVKRSLSRNCSPRTTYNCDICDSSFITETGLRAHIIGSHPCFCRTCGKQGPPGEAPAGGDYVCNSCMENGSCFDNTPRSPNPEKKFRCSFCPQRFLYLATKKSHEKKHQETNEEGYNYDNFRACSTYLANMNEDNKQDYIKREETDSQECTDMKSEIVEGGHFPIDKHKIEDTTDFMSLTPYKDVSYSHNKSPVPPCTDPLLSPTPSNMKHKKRINVAHSLILTSKNQTRDRDSDRNKDSSVVPRTNSLNGGEKSCKPLRKNDCDSKGSHIPLHKPEKWVCKEETFFKAL